MITYQEEKLCTCFEEMIPLLEEHWEEVALYKDKVILDIDIERYLTLENLGSLHVVTVRDSDVLVGYFISFINPHLHYKSTVYALNDVLFICPEYRHQKVAKDLFSFAESGLKKRGVDVIILHMKVDHPFHTLSNYLGYEQAEYTYSKYVGED